jgi:hypothetical protein
MELYHIAEFSTSCSVTFDQIPIRGLIKFYRLLIILHQKPTVFPPKQEQKFHQSSKLAGDSFDFFH